MPTEFEAKVLDIDPDAMAATVLAAGGVKVGEAMMRRRYVYDIAAGDELLGRLGFASKSYQENRRTSFTLHGAELEIDAWPLIPPYLEIEGRSSTTSSRSRPHWASTKPT